MADIIGVNPNFEAECSNCGTQFRFKSSEVRAGKEIAGSDGDDYERVVTCPEPTCTKPVRVTGTMSREARAKLQSGRDQYGSFDASDFDV